MTERSYPFDDPGATGYANMPEEYWAKAFRYHLGTGVLAVTFPDALNELKVSQAGTPAKSVIIDTGSAHIQGHHYENDSAALTVTVPANTALTSRIDYIVLECKWGPSGGISAKCISGTVNATAPTLYTNEGVLWQMPLAKLTLPQNYAAVTTAMITDARNFVSSGNAKSATYVVATYDASPSVRANADAVLPDQCINADVYINAAIAFVYNNFGGGTVLLSEGTFTIAAHITAKQNVNIAGFGSGTKIVGNSSLDVGIECSSVDGITIRDLNISLSYVGCTVGQWPGQTAGEGIRVVEGKNVSIDRCDIHHCGITGIMLESVDSSATSSYGHKIRACSITDCVHGIWVQTNGGLIANNVIYNCGYGMVFSADPDSPWGASINTITGNSIRHIMCTGVIFRGWTTMNCTQNLFAGNLISNCGMEADNIHMCMLLEGVYCFQNTIVSNTIQSWEYPQTLYGIVIATDVGGNSIMNNYCENASKLGGDHNIYTTDGGSNWTPNWIRWNHSGASGPTSPGSYDA